MSEKVGEVITKLERDQALAIERRLGMHWEGEEGGECEIDEARSGYSGLHPPEEAVRLTALIDRDEWPWEFAFTIAWDKNFEDAARKAGAKLIKQLELIEADIVSSDF